MIDAGKWLRPTPQKYYFLWNNKRQNNKCRNNKRQNNKCRNNKRQNN